ncbi:SWIM zinc finger family protein [Aerococcus urinae]
MRLLGQEFPKKIYERGYLYYAEDRVENSYVKDQTYHFWVRGNENYQVQFDLDQEAVVAQMTCDCPYADSGKPCKHMAAAALYYQFGPYSEYAMSHHFPELDRLLAQMSRLDLLHYFKQVLLDHPQVANAVYDKLLQREDEVADDEIKVILDLFDEVDDIYSKHSQSGKIHIFKGFALIEDLTKYLNNNLNDILHHGQSLIALMLLNHVIEMVDQVEFEEEFGQAALVINLCDQAYGSIVAYLSQDEREEGLAMLLALLNNHHSFWIDLLLPQVIGRHFDRFHERRRLLKACMYRMETLQKKFPNQDLEWYFEALFKLYQELEPSEKVVDFASQHLEYLASVDYLRRFALSHREETSQVTDKSEKYPVQILTGYLKQALVDLETAKSRPQYQSIATFLKNMDSISGGQFVRHCFINQLKEDYPHRQVLIEEFSRSW